MSEQIGVVLPCTPNPTTGFFFYLPRREVVELSISGEDLKPVLMIICKTPFGMRRS